MSRRFASSAIVSLLSILKSYKSLVTAYIANRQSEDEEDPVKYAIRGWDYALELCLIIDLMQPITKVMCQVQKVNHNVWQAKSWIEQMIAHTEEALAALSALKDGTGTLESLGTLPAGLFPVTARHSEELAQYRFQGLELLAGWTIETEDRGGVKWQELTFIEVVGCICTLFTRILSNIKDRYDIDLSVICFLFK